MLTHLQWHHSSHRHTSPTFPFEPAWDQSVSTATLYFLMHFNSLTESRDLCACVVSHLVISDSLQPHGLQPTRLLCPWDFPCKNTGMGCYFLPQRIFLTQGSNKHHMSLLHWRVDSSPTGKPRDLQWQLYLAGALTTFPVLPFLSSNVWITLSL